MTVLAWPDMDEETQPLRHRHSHISRASISPIPGTARCRASRRCRASDRPYVPIVFFAFRIMVGIGVILLATAITGAVLRWRGRLYETRWFQLLAMATTPLGFIAVLAGWTTTEAGRQPWVIYGHLRTADAVAPVTARRRDDDAADLLRRLQRAAARLPVVCRTHRHPRAAAADAPPTRSEIRPGLDRSGPTIVGSDASRDARLRRQPASSSEHDAMITRSRNRSCRSLFAGLVAFCVVVYVLADGFDLGVGILFLLAPRDEDRDLMMASIEPVWDGNETWLVMGGTLLLAAFPAGYYVLLPAFYLPVMFMLFALIFRGIAFEFRLQTGAFRWVWDLAFAGGSMLATLCQGLILGGLINGVDRCRTACSPAARSTSSACSACFAALGLVGGYALLGAGWLIWKTDGPTQVFAREVAHSALILTAAMMLLVSAWSAWSVPEVAAALVRLAEHRLSRPGADGHRGGAADDLAAHLGRARGRDLPARHRRLPARLRRPRRQPLALRRAAPCHHLGRHRRPADPRLRRHRRRASSFRSCSPIRPMPIGCSAARRSISRGYGGAPPAPPLAGGKRPLGAE